MKIVVTQNLDLDSEQAERLKALDNKLLGAAIDPGDISVGDTNSPTYQKLIAHPKILATPHIAFNTDVSAKIANDMMIENIKAWLDENPANLLL
jgi:phosphoglycerate dehydrogenase-like enzyme